MFLYPYKTKPQCSFHLLQCCHLVAPCCSMCSLLNCFSSLSTHLTKTTLHGNNGCHVNWGMTNSIIQSINQSLNQPITLSQYMAHTHTQSTLHTLHNALPVSQTSLFCNSLVHKGSFFKTSKQIIHPFGYVNKIMYRLYTQMHKIWGEKCWGYIISSKWHHRICNTGSVSPLMFSHIRTLNLRMLSVRPQQL